MHFIWLSIDMCASIHEPDKVETNVCKWLQIMDIMGYCAEYVLNWQLILLIMCFSTSSGHQSGKTDTEGNTLKSGVSSTHLS